jgi:N-acetylglucosamine-6-sulfatase
MRRLRLCLLAFLSICLVVGLSSMTWRAAAARDSNTTSTEAVQARASRPRPNIVLITADDMRADDLRVMPQTKRLLRAGGVDFADAISPYPLCCPARATLVTGQYAHNHKVLGNEFPYGGYKKLYRTGGERESLAVWLRRAGYHTSFIGKYLNYYGSTYRSQASTGPRYVPPGWDDWNASVGQVFRYFCVKLNQNGRLRRFPGRYQTDLYTDLARNRIRRLADRRRPFFLWMSQLAPHRGYRPRKLSRPCGPTHPRGVPGAPRHEHMFDNARLPASPARNEADMSDKGAYMSGRAPLTGRELAKVTREYRGRLESLQALDQSVARTVQTLRTQGVLRNTVIVFTSDNGWLLGEHRSVGKILPYEESLRVPLLIRGPGFRPGAVRRQPVGLPDIPATAVALARARPHVGRPLDGVSLAYLARHPRYLSRRVIPIEAGPRPSVQRAYGGVPNYYYRGVRTSGHTYIDWQFADGRVDEEVYDLAADPDQMESLDDVPSEELDLLRLLSGALEGCVGRTCVATLPNAQTG